MPPVLGAAPAELDQGSVIDGAPWTVDPLPLGIVLTNTCDFANGNAHYVVLAALKDAKAILHTSSEFQTAVVGAAAGGRLNNRQWEGLERILLDYVHNRKITRYFFIDGEDRFGAGVLLFVDFQHVLSVPIDRARALPHVATLLSPDRENLVIHFAAYTSRVGVDRLSAARTRTVMEQLAAPYHRAPAAAPPAGAPPAAAPPCRRSTRRSARRDTADRAVGNVVWWNIARDVGYRPTVDCGIVSAQSGSRAAAANSVIRPRAPWDA